MELLPVQLTPPLGAASPLPRGEGQGEGVLQFGGQASASPSAGSQPAASRTTVFHFSDNQAPTPNSPSQIPYGDDVQNLRWDATAASRFSMRIPIRVR